MRQWSIEVRHGRLDSLPDSLRRCADQQRSASASCFFVSEGGSLLNEPEKSHVSSVLSGASPSVVIALMSEAVGWVFDCLEVELDQDFQFNYLKVSFVNLAPSQEAPGNGSGKMTTNHPELPDPLEVSADMILHQITTALSRFFSHVRAAVRSDGWDVETFSCDWVALTLTKA
jgi:hypothetical protein